MSPTDELQRGIAELGLASLSAQIQALARPCIRITTTPNDSLPLGASRFGGLPDLAPGTEWPTCSAGRLGFSAQLDLTDLADLPTTLELPTAGLLSLFVFEGDGIQPGYDGTPGEVQLLYTPPGVLLEAAPAPADLTDYNAARPACALTLEAALDLPGVSAFSGETDRVDPAHQPDLDAIVAAQALEPFDKLRDRLHPAAGHRHQLFGYPLHYRTSTDATPADHLTLLVLTSDDHLEWNWCDGEHLSLSVPRAAFPLADTEAQAIPIVGSSA